MQVHGIGGAAGVLWYALMAKKELVTELYGDVSVPFLDDLSAQKLALLVLAAVHSCPCCVPYHI